MYDILGVGLALVDIVLMIDSFPVRGGCAYVRSEEMFVGGCAANLLISASKLGLNTALITKLGKDDVGRFIIDKLKEHRIDTRYVKFERCFSGKVYTAMDREGERTFFSVLPNSAVSRLSASDLEIDAIRRSRVLFGDGAMFFGREPAQAVLKAMEFARREGVTVAFDPNIRVSEKKMPPELRKLIEKALEFTDILLINEEEARMLTEKDDLADILEAFRNAGVQIIALKLGSRGCAITSDQGSVYCPAFNLEAVDIVGAGDAFNAGFIYGYLQGWSIDRIGIFANAVGGLKVTRKGASSSPTLEEVERLIKAQQIRAEKLE